MSSHPFLRPHGRLEKTTLPRTPSESPGPTQSSTPSSSSTLANVPNDKPSPSTLSDERGVPDASQCLFPIEWDRIRYNRKPVPSIRYRQPHKRAINSKSQPSAIYRHGAQLTTDGDNKYWLCKYCHICGHHDAALFASESTTSIIYHLKQQHRLEEFGYKSTGPDPFSIAKRATSLTPYLGSRRVVFSDLKFKDDFTDWVIDLDLTFDKAYPGYRISADTMVHFGPPAGIILESEATKDFHFVGMPPGTVLLMPMTVGIQCQRKRPWQQNDVSRKGLPCAASFACTDYKVQSRTLERVALELRGTRTTNVDGRVVPSQCDPYSLYVQLSRCRTLDGIMLVSKVRERDLVGNRVPEEMTAAQARLEKLSDRTVEEALRWLDENSEESQRLR